MLGVDECAEADVSQGLILLAFLAIVVALLTGRLRRRIGLPVTTRTIIVVAVGFAIVVLALWAAQH
ncbi:MAG: hypothetical protein ACLQDY_04345 [Streptosporangiaceae bacterium]